jgi:adenosylcobinamide-phosphate synthase
MRRAAANAVGLVAGFALDAVVGDPRRGHPVAAYGRATAALERRVYRPTRGAGMRYAALAVGVPAAVAAGANLATRGRPMARAALVAGATWAALGARTLRREATVMAEALDRGDLPAARGRLSHLCGRDPSGLDEPELSRATVESIAENTSDAVVAPLFWGAVAGLPGLVGYRAANTLDAMVGHRSARYARFGTAAARLDDLLNLAPSRLTAALIAATAPLAGGDPGRALRIWRRDGGDHPSPNAGQCESAMAGALGVRLGGRNVYFGRSETRPLMGDGPRPDAEDVRRAAALSGAVAVVALGFAALAAAARIQSGAARIQSGAARCRSTAARIQSAAARDQSARAARGRAGGGRR